MSAVLAALVVALGQKPPGEVAKGLMAPALRPEAAFRALLVGEGRALPEALRVQVARDVTRRLADRLDAVRDPAARFDQLRPVRDEAKGLPAAVRLPLDRLYQATWRQALTAALDDVRGPADAGRWPDAAEKARSWLTRLRKVRPADDRELAAVHAAAEAACEKAADVAARLAALDAYRAALDAKAGAADVDATRLPESLRAGHDALRGVAELAAAKWDAAPDVAALRGSVGRLTPGLDAGLAKRVALELAVKAFAAGHPAAARKFLPPDAPPEHVAAVLRDLKALTLGGTKMETGSVAPVGPGLPAGVAPLVPEAKRAGWRPPAPAASPSALDEAMKAAAKVRESAVTAVAAERGKIDAADARKALADAHARAIAPEVEERKRFATVEYRLGRRLTGAERTAVREWVEDGKPVADVLPTLAAPDDEARFLADVARLLGRAPTPDERQQARALRRDGRRAAEVAELLR